MKQIIGIILAGVISVAALYSALFVLEIDEMFLPIMDGSMASVTIAAACLLFFLIISSVALRLFRVPNTKKHNNDEEHENDR